MKYFIVFTIMSIAGALGIVNNPATKTGADKVKVEYIEFVDPIIIQPG